MPAEHIKLAQLHNVKTILIILITDVIECQPRSWEIITQFNTHEINKFDNEPQQIQSEKNGGRN